MSNPLMVVMPAELTVEMLREVRRNALTTSEDPDEMHRRIGWLICAWDVLVECQQRGPQP